MEKRGCANIERVAGRDGEAMGNGSWGTVESTGFAIDWN
jgi:hypothetical protein